MADPISYAVGSAVLSATGSFAAASAVSTVAFYAVSAAPFLLSAVVAEQQRNAFKGALTSVNDDRSTRNAIPDSNPEWRMHLGTFSQAGDPFFSEGGKSRRPYIWQGVVLADHRCSRLRSVTINNTKIEIDPATGFAISPPFYDGTTAFIEVSFRNGALDQGIDPIIERDFPEIASDYRHLGKATAVTKLHYGTGGSRDAQDDKHRELFGDGNVTVYYELDGALPFDPRDPNQFLGDQDSWQFSRNASLNTMYAVLWKHPEMLEVINWDLIAAAADIDDEWVFDKTGRAYRRHTVDGVVLDSVETQEMLSSLLTANGGTLLRNESKLYIMPAQPLRPVGTIHLGNILGGFSFSGQTAIDELVNEQRMEFVSVDHGYRVQPGPVIVDEATVLADGLRRSRTTRYPFSVGSSRAQRLNQRVYREARQQGTISTGVDRDAEDWKSGDVVNVSLPGVHSRFNGVWKILKIEAIGMLEAYQVYITRYSDSVHQYDPASDEQDFVAAEDPVEG